MGEIAIIGGGAAGFFAALAAKEHNPEAKVAIYEKGSQLLSKVRISGGGRCNVTHACFEPKELVKNYPRGSKELLGPFHHFGPRETVEWFEGRGVKLKTEADGRMFPVTDSSQTIIDCLMNEAERLGVEIHLKARIESLDQFERVVLATGGSRQGHQLAVDAGHTIQEPVPSLFTFNIGGFDLADLAGVSVPEATVRLSKELVATGPLLITHWGFSGPAVLRLSAWGARFLHERGYSAELQVEWPEQLPRRLRGRQKETYQIEGKTTHKAEFVTCGGVTLSEVDFRTMESKKRPGLHFAGEVLDIDGITGGFNFQNAWTTGYLACGRPL
jgi:predicted Rossmann fold flavoprotein